MKAWRVSFHSEGSPPWNTEEEENRRARRRGCSAAHLEPVRGERVDRRRERRRRDRDELAVGVRRVGDHDRRVRAVRFVGERPPADRQADLLDPVRRHERHVVVGDVARAVRLDRLDRDRLSVLVDELVDQVALREPELAEALGHLRRHHHALRIGRALGDAIKEAVAAREKTRASARGRKERKRRELLTEESASGTVSAAREERRKHARPLAADDGSSRGAPEHPLLDEVPAAHIHALD